MYIAQSGMGIERTETKKTNLTARQRVFALTALIIAGETIFFLPFVIPRVFRPTFLAVFDISNLELGTFISVYGIVAIAAYLFGGPLADKYPPHRLMALALFTTGLGGLYLATLPSLHNMLWLYGAWGLTTIFLFWASLMRTTRVVGGDSNQGKAFGLLDGGRGLVAAIVGSLAVMVLAHFLPEDVSAVLEEERRAAFQKVILFFCAFVFVTSGLIWWILKPMASSSNLSFNKLTWKGISEVLTLPAVWFQAFIIICAYSGYRVADDISLMAMDVLGYDEVESAGIGTLSLWLRPVAAITAGYFADKLSASRMIMISFIIMFIGGISLGFGPIDRYAEVLVMISIVCTCIGVFAMRGLYFAVMEEGAIPLHATGTAVGFASIIGYLPDIYMGPLMGVLLDEYPGVQGHRYVFMLLAVFSVLGFIAVLLFRRHTRNIKGLSISS